MMLTRDNLHDYQVTAVNHMDQHPNSMLWMGMGLGKTITTLTNIMDRINRGEVKKVLIFGPVRVITSVWAKEARNWEHTKKLRFSLIHGNPTKRARAMFADADVHLCNYENMNWLAEQLCHYYLDQNQPLPYDMVVYDEVSKMKNSTSLRVAGGRRDREIAGETYTVKVIGWRKIIPHFKYRVGLTGTPASNGYLDLHGQFLAVDGGKRLGEYVTHYKDSYFKSDYMGWGYEVTPLGKEFIEKRISDITVKMDTKDYLDMPDVKVTNMMVTLPPKARKAYDEMEANMFSALDTGTEIEVFSRSAVSNKCLQYCLAGETEILTNTGWKRIDQFKQGDLVYDGDEWVSVHSLAFQGVKEVIKLDGVWMTPDHKVLTKSGWTNAEDINDDNRFNRTKVQLPRGFETNRINKRESQKSFMVGSLHLWKGIRNHWTEFKKSESTRGEVLRMSSWRNNSEREKQPRNDQDKTIYDLDKHEIQMSKSKRQGLSELWCTRYNSVRRVVRFVSNILERYGRDLSKSFVYRTSGQQQGLLQGELSMGYSTSTIQQSQKLYISRNTVRKDDDCSSISKIWGSRCYHKTKNEEELVNRSDSKTCKVYDLINSGKRNRFVVRGENGQIFIVHNCNGSPYLSAESDEYEKLHDAKLDALEEVLEEAAGQPVLCSYTFKSDAERIMKRFKKYRPVNLTQEKASRTGAIINKWNKGGIKLLIGHPASMGHGVDGLQKSGNILVWFGMNWSLELYDQMNARINRQGQNRPVSIIRILCNDTVDLAVADAIERKTDDEQGLKSAIDRYRKGITTNSLEVNFF